MNAALKKIRKTKGLSAKIAAELCIARQTVYGWKKIPAERVIKVEAITGIPRTQLRPDLYPVFNSSVS
jgi:DNA-binding transcriptional regulator YdaS (Cro superfamily)